MKSLWVRRDVAPFKIIYRCEKRRFWDFCSRF